MRDSSELVVTARKRDESLIDVPISITAVTGEAMARQPLRTVADIATDRARAQHQLPTPSAARSSRSAASARRCRPACSPASGVFQDGIYVPYTSYVNNPTLDIARIEVLRGPQGTLYGKNTLGGAINVITRPPSDVFEGNVYATGSSRGRVEEGRRPHQRSARRVQGARSRHRTRDAERLLPRTS